jgi:hypothetical protein
MLYMPYPVVPLKGDRGYVGKTHERLPDHVDAVHEVFVGKMFSVWSWGIVLRMQRHPQAVLLGISLGTIVQPLHLTSLQGSAAGGIQQA